MIPPHLTSPSVRARHGFFGRAGGVSTGHVAGLNAGFGGDDHDNVVANRARVQSTLSASHLFLPRQTHSAIAMYVGGPAEAVSEADATITDQPGLAIGVITADCVPILFEADGWVGAAHAGWRGSLSGIIEATIALFGAHGVQPDTLRCAIGPSLRSPLFEVGDDLKDDFTEQFPDAERFFSPTAQDTDADKQRFDFDHTGFCQWRLTEAGILTTNIADVGGNTLADPDTWFSYRASRQNGNDGYGRNLSAICINAG